MKTCVALRHVAFEDLGILEPLLEARGFAIRIIDAVTADLSPFDPLADDLMVILGGPIGVYEEAAYPFLTEELRLITRRLEAERPTLGVCLGCQLMARALGARVYPNPEGKEIGWSALQFSAEGAASCLEALGDAQVLHWHGDTFDLPRGAVRLASTPRTPNQAFAWGLRALGVQFHIEVTEQGLDDWYVGHAAELAGAGLSVPELRADGRTLAPRLAERGTVALGRWIDEVCG